MAFPDLERRPTQTKDRCFPSGNAEWYPEAGVPAGSTQGGFNRRAPGLTSIGCNSPIALAMDFIGARRELDV
jgi:hypothetical protein